MPHRVLTDANVLFSKTLRDWLVLMDIHGAPYKTYWSEDILAEVIHGLRREHPTWPGHKITAVRDQIATSLEGGRVEDYTVDGTFPGKDADDQHVHAAALACSAEFVLTAESRFVPPQAHELLPYEIYNPDDFFVLVDDSVPDAVREVARMQAEYWVAKHGEADLCGRLRAAGCPHFAERVRVRLQEVF